MKKIKAGNYMVIRDHLWFILLLTFFTGCQSGEDTTSNRPNILFIMADDHTSQAFKSYGSRLAEIAPTDNINRLAKEGARLTNVFATNSICVPSRASILTGQYSHKNEVYTLADSIDPKLPHVGKELQKAGYQTALIGKWHLESKPSGFDFWEVLPGQGRYHDPIMINQKGEKNTFEGFSADVITDKTLNWLKNQRNKEQPFVLMTHFKSSHGPFGFASRNDSLFANQMIPEPPSLWEDKSHRSQGSAAYGYTINDMAERLTTERWGSWKPYQPLDSMTVRQERRTGYQQMMKRYLRSVASIDQNMGRILDYLDKAGLSGNTIVIYTSDQGYFLGEHNYIDKRWMYEESIRMPFLIRYPREIPEGSVNDDIITNIDFAPLLLDYAGIKIPDYMQGKSFRANLRGNTPENWQQAMYYRYWMHGSGAKRPAHYGIRTQRYKLIFFYGLPLGHTENPPTRVGWELYDLARDPHELDNVYNDPAYAKVADSLKNELLQLKEKYEDTDEKHPELIELREKVWE